jgi:LacI family transcriptional regulator
MIVSITAKELAKILKLSEAAISMVLNNKRGVSTKTRKIVLETAEKYGFDFSRIQENNYSSKTKGVITMIIYKKHGAVVSDTPFFSELSEGIENACRMNSYILNIKYLFEGDDINEALKEILKFGNKGIILLGTEMHKNDFNFFNNLEVPMVILDTYFEGCKKDCVLINNVQGAYLATSHLIKNCKKQPGYLKSSYKINNFLERSDGFYKAIRENGMSSSNSIVHELSPSMEGAYGDMLLILKEKEKIEKCYFADNDLIAVGAIKALKEFGYIIPSEISIIGFDNMPICKYIDPPLTTVNVPKYYMGNLAVKRLIELIEDCLNEPIKIEVNTKLVIRNSVK